MISKPNDPELTIFFDGQCPLCLSEIKQLQRRDSQSRIVTEDINAHNFEERFPMIDIGRAAKELHGLTADGRLLLGLDVTHKAWSLVGMGFFTGLLRLPVMRTFADYGYRVFARNRYAISRLLTGQGRLGDCQACRKAGNQE